MWRCARWCCRCGVRALVWQFKVECIPVCSHRMWLQELARSVAVAAANAERVAARCLWQSWHLLLFQFNIQCNWKNTSPGPAPTWTAEISNESPLELVISQLRRPCGWSPPQSPLACFASSLILMQRTITKAHSGNRGCGLFCFSWFLSLSGVTLLPAVCVACVCVRARARCLCHRQTRPSSEHWCVLSKHWVGVT